MDDQPVTPQTQDAPEGYLARYEVIALHLPVTIGGAKFYPFNNPCFYHSSIVNNIPGACLHFPQSARVEPRAACRHDDIQLSCRRYIFAVILCKEFQADVSIRG